MNNQLLRVIGAPQALRDAAPELQMESGTQHAEAVQQPAKMAHKPSNRAIWHANCPDRRWPSPMRPLQETKLSCGATMRLWECVVCKAQAWHGYRPLENEQ